MACRQFHPQNRKVHLGLSKQCHYRSLLFVVVAVVFYFLFIWKMKIGSTHTKLFCWNLFHPNFIPLWAIYCFVDNEVNSITKIIEFVCLLSSNCQSFGSWFLILVWQFTFYIWQRHWNQSRRVKSKTAATAKRIRNENKMKRNVKCDT